MTVELIRPPECLAKCDEHQAQDGVEMPFQVITTPCAWPIYDRTGSKARGSGDVETYEFENMEYEEPQAYLCRCCQHGLKCVG